MGVRQKSNSKFTHSGQDFLWWVDNDTFIRIASDEDKDKVVHALITTRYLLRGADGKLRFGGDK